MTFQEHVIAVVEPTRYNKTTLEFSKQIVDRGGRATVVVILNGDDIDAIAGFASAEGMTVPDARVAYTERLTQSYKSQVGGEATTVIITNRLGANKVVLDAAARNEITAAALPQRLLARRSWKTTVARLRVPVMLAPSSAA